VSTKVAELELLLKGKYRVWDEDLARRLHELSIMEEDAELKQVLRDRKREYVKPRITSISMAEFEDGLKNDA
jgi:hypothetical protein